MALTNNPPTPEDYRKHFGLIVGLAVGAVLLIGFLAVVGVLRSNNAVDRVAKVQKAFEADIAHRRVTACLQYNRLKLDDRETFKQAIRELGTPAQLATPQAMEVLGRWDAKVDQRQRLRDCSPAGLAAYSEAPAAANIACVGDGHGFCR